MGRPPHHKADLERAALHLFVENGVDGTSIRDIAARAGVTEGALYRHYDSKDGLVRALFLMHHRTFADRLREACEGAASPAGRIRSMIDAFYRLHDEDPAVFEFILMTRHAILDSVRQGPENPVDVAAGVIADGMKAGAWPRQNLALATEIALGIVLEIPVGKRFGRLRGRTSSFTDEVAKAVIAALRR